MTVRKIRDLGQLSEVRLRSDELVVQSLMEDDVVTRIELVRQGNGETFYIHLSEVEFVLDAIDTMIDGRLS